MNKIFLATAVMLSSIITLADPTNAYDCTGVVMSENGASSTARELHLAFTSPDASSVTLVGFGGAIQVSVTHNSESNLTLQIRGDQQLNTDINLIVVPNEVLDDKKTYLKVTVQSLDANLKPAEGDSKYTGLMECTTFN